ncbi:NAD(P)/FAD-dependent oxidoreductase [Spongiimicrobium salis]|uniref:NAD(P)/FAD-dependent oxidoreductase n=1 Tax=Spongiimicrobium salis TaxID=1667022 RepID=UPI00374C8F9E
MQASTYDVIIIGGGLAGLTAALHLSKKGLQVAVFEKQTYPHHKVCGEYVSNEIKPYLNYLDVSLKEANAVAIDTFQLSTVKGKSLRAKLPLGGMGISRYAFDDLLYRKALAQGVTFVFETVDKVHYQNGVFSVASIEHTTFLSPLVIGAYGKRAQLDKRLERNFIQNKSSWLGVKAHYEYDFPENLVALHNFNGGYGGLSKTESGTVNFCYLANYKTFKAHKNIENFNENVVAQNPFLNAFLKEASLIFEKPMSIAQISFHPKNAIENHIIMCGDTAGLIHPLCGNGMAMAIHSAKIASELILNFHGAKDYSREMLESDYEKLWNITFKQRLYTGRQLQRLLLNQKLSNAAMGIVTQSPLLIKTLIKKTHGKPITC